MDRDPRMSPDTIAQRRTASDPTIWADYFNLGGGVESNTGNCSGPANSAEASSYHCANQVGHADFAAEAHLYATIRYGVERCHS